MPDCYMGDCDNGRLPRHSYPREKVVRPNSLTKEEFLRLPVGTVFYSCHEQDGNVDRRLGTLRGFEEKVFGEAVDTEYGVQVCKRNYSDCGLDPYVSDNGNFWNSSNWIELVPQSDAAPRSRSRRCKKIKCFSIPPLRWQEVGF